MGHSENTIGYIPRREHTSYIYKNPRWRREMVRFVCRLLTCFFLTSENYHYIKRRMLHYGQKWRAFIATQNLERDNMARISNITQ